MLTIDALQASHPSRDRFEEWRTGNVGCVHVTLAIWEDARATLTTVGKWHQLLAEHADLIELATSAADIERIAADGRTAIVFGFQNTSPFEDDIELVSVFHALGVRIVQLTYNIRNAVGTGCWESEDPGVSEFYGRDVLREMNDVGMLIDVSHCAERTCFDAIEISSKPIAVTHANPAEFVGEEIELKRRTKSTPLLRALAERGGVIGLGMYPRMTPVGFTLQQFCEMVAWTVDLIGVDAVGFGTDFYTGHPESIVTWWRAGRWARESAVPIDARLAGWPDWFQSPAMFPSVLEGLAAVGFSSQEIAQIAGGNWLRLFREVF